MANTYSDSQGNRYTTAQIERRITKAAKEMIQDQLDEHGYNFCTKCRRNDCKPIDASHNVSRKQAKEEGRVEILWDKNNLELIGRRHHQEKDGLDLKFTTNGT